MAADEVRVRYPLAGVGFALARLGAVLSSDRLVKLGARVALALAFVALLAGCGANALKVHAVVASAAADSIDVAGRVIIRTEGGELNAAVGAARTEAEGRAALDGIHARWSPLVAAHDALAAAQRAYADGIVEVAAGHETTLTLITLAGVLIRVWASVAREALALGVHLPGPPAGLVTAASTGGQ